MIILEEGKQNSIWIKVNASIDISGFSLVLAACGTMKTISDLTAKNLKVEFTEQEVAKTSEDGTYGTLIVYDGDGKEYITIVPLFKRVPASEASKTIGFQTIYLTIASTKEASSGSSGGDTPTGDYVTKDELNSAISRAKKYTDDSIDDIETTIINEQPVEVLDKDGNPMTITVQETAQQVVDQQTTIERAMETHLHGEVKDEDHDGQPDQETLYLNSGKEKETITI